MMYYSNFFESKDCMYCNMYMVNRMDFLFFWDNFSTYNGTCAKLKLQTPIAHSFFHASNSSSRCAFNALNPFLKFLPHRQHVMSQLGQFPG